MTRHIAFAGFSMESVTAVPRVATREDFERACLCGDQIPRRYRGTNSVPGGALETLEARGARMHPLFATALGAQGPASDEAVEAFADALVRGLERAGALDGLILNLNGACWAPGFEDVERYMIDRARAAAPDLPIAVPLDFHGNVDARTIAGADIAVAHHHTPHVDMAKTGARAAGALLRMIETGERPALAVARPGIVLSPVMSATGLEPLASIIAEARGIEAGTDGACDISVLGGFAYADNANTGMSVICLDWQDADAAAARARALADRLWEERDELGAAVPVWRPEDALDDIAEHPPRGCPVLLLEHADRMNDSTHLLRALLERDLGRVHAPFLLDPDSAARAHAAGAGAEVTLRLGGHSAPEAGGPLDVTARVAWSGHKSFTVSGRHQEGTAIDLGLTALVDIGRVRVSIVSRRAPAVDGDPFYIFDERPEDYDVILLRSKTHFRDFYEPLAETIYIVETPDLGPSDVRRVPFRRLDTSRTYPWFGTSPAA